MQQAFVFEWFYEKIHVLDKTRCIVCNLLCPDNPDMENCYDDKTNVPPPNVDDAYECLQGMNDNSEENADDEKFKNCINMLAKK
jgi:hypothetical protein